MSKRTAPVFRKSVGGYKKEDVNSYIVNMSKRFNDSEAEYKNEITSLKSKLAELEEQLAKERLEREDEISVTQAVVSAKESAIADLNIQVEELTNKYEAAIADVQVKQELICDLNKKLDEASKAPAAMFDAFGGVTDPSEKAMLFDCISAKTGEIMLIACKTADDIISQAKKEADQIIAEANTRKETMLRSISGSADSVTSDISSYIRTAVDGCLEKIYSSIKSVDSGKK